MPLDFMASENQKSIDERTPVFSLSEATHRLLLNAATPRKAFQKIHKFSDYYSDTSILFGEAQPLILEIETAIKAKKITSLELNELIKFLDNAYKKKLNIYVYCD